MPKLIAALRLAIGSSVSSCNCQFDIGKYKEETMAFPPSVTVKGLLLGRIGRYLNPKRGQQPARFKTIIQVAPGPPV